MDLINWLPSITTTSLLALALWLSRKLIETRLTRSVEHEFNTKLEAVRAEFRAKEELLKADLRSKESEITSLRNGTMTAMASRQIALDRRRLEAVDQLWSAVTAFAPARAISGIVAVLRFDAAQEEAAENPQFRQMFDTLSTGFDPKAIELSASEKARPFVSPIAWALFTAYKAIAMQAVLKLYILRFGVGTKGIVDKQFITKLVKTALPHQAAYIDKFGDSGCYYLLEELEEKLLGELQKVLSGVENDKASLEQAAEILRLSKEMSDAAQLKGMQLSDAMQRGRGKGAPEPEL